MLSAITPNFVEISKYFKKIITRRKHAMIAKDTYNQLYKLTDRELKDIGINRSDIRAISNEVFYNG
jgi:uncharacterized protein YjiS (DUF1127 family)